AAMHPQYVRRNEIPANVMEKEREIQLAQLATTKKPPEILEKIVTGKMEKFYGDVCLDEQVYVRDPEGKQNVGTFLQQMDAGIRVEQFVRYQVGG
ncbi:MAG: elongation factor Ts, partial [Deltaproteobacteria bacterium]|nr:elongation factor Ts [Deltaproteobacteria bacterium]